MLSGRRVLGWGLLVGLWMGCIYLPEPDVYAGLGPGDVTGVALGRLQGVQTQRPVPFQGVTVRLEGSAQRSITGGDGRFTLRNLPEGNHPIRLTVGQADHPLAMLRVVVRMRAVDGRRALVDMGPLELLEPASVVGDVNIQGQGTMEDVRVTAVDGAGARPVLGDNAVVTPQAGGVFELGGLGAGTWRLLVTQGARTLLTAPFTLAPGIQHNVGTLVLPTVTARVDATVQLTLRAPPVTSSVPVLVTLAPGHQDLRACSTTVPFLPEPAGLTVVVTGCVAGGPYALTIDSDGAYLPYTRDSVLLPWEGNDLGDVFLTLAQDCPDCEPQQVPDAGVPASSSSRGIASSGSNTSSGNASSSSMALSSSGAGGSGSSALSGTSFSGSSSGGLVEMGMLVPTVPGATAFNSWVRNVDGDRPPLLATPCALGMMQTLQDCQHVGVHREMTVTTVADCGSISEIREVGASNGNVFNWACRGVPARVWSTGFTAGHGLADLLDWSLPTPVFRTDFQVEVLVNGNVVAQSLPGTLWTDEVSLNRGNITAATYGTQPLVVALDADLTQDLRVQRDNVAITVSPLIPQVNLDAFALVAEPLSNRVYLEGSYAGNLSAPQLKVESIVGPVEAVRIHNLHTAAGLLLARTTGVHGTDIHADGSANLLNPQIFLDVGTSLVELQDVEVLGGQFIGIQVGTSSGVSLRGLRLRDMAVGIQVDTAGAIQGMVLLQDVDVQDATSDGVVINNADDVRMSDIRVANSAARGLVVSNADRVVLVGGTFSNNGSHGLAVQGVAGSVFRGVVAAHNGGDGVHASVMTESVLAEVTAVYNAGANIFLDGLTFNKVSRVVAMGAGQQGLHVSDLTAAQNNLFIDLATAGNTLAEVSIQGGQASGATVLQGTLLLGANGCGLDFGHPDLGTGCAPRGASTHTVTSVTNLTTEFSGPVAGVTAAATDLTTLHRWLEDPSATRVWAPNPVAAGPCTGGCALMDYALAFSATQLRSVAWTSGTVLIQHDLQGAMASQQLCESLGGTLSGLCTITHVLPYAPQDTTPGVTAGLCKPVSGCTTQAPCNCTPVSNIGAYQGHNGYLQATTAGFVPGDVLIHPWATNGF